MNTISSQPRYQKMIAEGASLDDIVNAGFIEEPSGVHHVHLPHVDEAGCIILLTGCFAPIHSGHIQSMVVAKEYLEATGRPVAAGFFSFCHDDYVSTKTSLWEASRRITYFNQHPEKESWMHACEYESANVGALNFTTVYDAIKEHYRKDVVMIVGSDNQSFAQVFAEDELVIIFSREIPSTTCRSNVINLQSPHPSMASSKIRAK